MAVKIVRHFLLVLCFSLAHTKNDNLTNTNAMSRVNLEPTTSSSKQTIATDTTETTSPFTSTAAESDSVTKTTMTNDLSTEYFKTTNVVTTATKTTLMVTSVARNDTQTQNSRSTSDVQLSSSTTSNSREGTKKGLGLSISERNTTIIFSVVLGTCIVGVAFFLIHKCKHKAQYLHQPMIHTENIDSYLTDEDTLVISGGLYDGNMTNDDVPTFLTNQSLFHLELLD